MSKSISRMSAAIAAACLLQAAPAWSDTTVRETVTTTIPPGETTVRKTVTETPDDSTPAATTRTETHYKTETHIVSGRGDHNLRFMDFDLNGDGRLSFNEVARMLFKIYDIDGNGVIDNVEYDKHTRVTVLPVEKDTTVTYDYGDGAVTTVQHTYEDFLHDSRLYLFAESHEGLSAHEFTGMDFTAVDVNRDHGIDLKEWQGTYVAAIDRKNRENARVNH